ncbi:MAG: ABC transporter permease [Anaerolineaceae bacterium]
MNKALHSFKTAAWLGWKIESNWTDPFLFTIYSIVKPLASAGILVVMYSVIAQSDFASPIFAYLYLGNAFYQYVGAVMAGLSWAIIDDREHYRTLKYIYVAPVRIPFYLLGRGVARFITTTFAVIVTIVFGVLFLKMPLNFAEVNWVLFFATLLVGIAMLATLGMMLAGITMNTARHSDMIGDAVAGGLFLFSGAIFPLSVLPVAIRWIGYVLPISYWLELMRRAMVGNVAAAFPTFSNLSNSEIMIILIIMTIVFAIASSLIFNRLDHRARERGLIDQTTNY